MKQTGDPAGNVTWDESILGDDFEDEFQVSCKAWSNLHSFNG